MMNKLITAGFVFVAGMLFGSAIHKALNVVPNKKAFMEHVKNMENMENDQ